MFYIGIDLGTTGCKGVLYDLSGQIYAEFNKEYPLLYIGDYIEQDANIWWALVKEAVISITQAANIHDIEGICLSTQGISFVPVDRDGEPLYNAISWLDERAVEETAFLEQAVGADALFAKTGKPLERDYTLPKLLWFQKNRKEIYDRAWKILMPLDFLNFKLTGKAVTDYTMAGGTMLYNIREKCWDSQLLSLTGLAVEKLPQVACLGTLLGSVLPDVAGELGISANTQVFLGGQDQKLAAIGAGIKEGVCTVSLGTATAITMLHKAFDERALFPEFRLSGDRFVSEGSLSTSGAALRWFAQTLFGGKSYRELDELALTSRPGANGVTVVPDFSENARIEGLTLATTQGDIVYALFEGVCRKVKECTDRFENINQLYVFGGGAKSDIWCRVMAEITGLDVYILTTAETASRGAAMIASGMKMPPAYIKKVIHSIKI